MGNFKKDRCTFGKTPVSQLHIRIPTTVYDHFAEVAYQRRTSMNKVFWEVIEKAYRKDKRKQSKVQEEPVKDAV